MDRNTKHLLRQWAIAIVLGGITLFGVIRAIIRGEYLIPCVIGAVLVLVIGQVWFVRRKALAVFQSANADQAVAYYRAHTSSLPNGRAMTVYMCALALAFYGDFDKARDELSTISWSALPPMYEGFRTHVLTVIALLQERDYRKAYALAAEARELCSTDITLPGSKQSRLATEALSHACQLVAGDGDDATVSRLENAVRTLPPIAVLIPAWALANHFSRTGNSDHAARYISVINKIAPHCQPLRTAELVP